MKLAVVLHRTWAHTQHIRSVCWLSTWQGIAYPKMANSRSTWSWLKMLGLVSEPQPCSSSVHRPVQIDWGITVVDKSLISLMVSWTPVQMSSHVWHFTCHSYNKLPKGQIEVFDLIYLIRSEVFKPRWALEYNIPSHWQIIFCSWNKCS